MCIICNMKSTTGESYAICFLEFFAKSSASMKDAADYLLAASDDAADEATRKRYKRIHKRMVKIRRDWNRLEHLRENLE